MAEFRVSEEVRMSEFIKVVIRIRPLIQREQQNEIIKWEVKENTISQIDDSSATSYTFDRVFDGCNTTQDLYEGIVAPIVNGAMAGFHGTIFAYGQTSSGKTHTMVGSKPDPGVIPLSIAEVFKRIDDTPDREFVLRASYLELYNEKLTDLLSAEEKKLTIQLDYQNNMATVANLTQRVITSKDAALQILEEGNARKKVAQNDRSSRSHCIFTMIIESRDKEEMAVMASHLNFVDLAGSEKAEENSGDRFKEGCAINKSLLCLSNVISKLSEGHGSQDFVVNYHDSNLTRILQNALGGNSKTAFICTATPASLDETHSTLRFASRAKVIKNEPIVNETLSEAALLKRFEEEFIQFQMETTRCETWCPSPGPSRRSLNPGSSGLTVPQSTVQAQEDSVIPDVDFDESYSLFPITEFEEEIDQNISTTSSVMDSISCPLRKEAVCQTDPYTCHKCTSLNEKNQELQKCLEESKTLCDGLLSSKSKMERCLQKAQDKWKQFTENASKTEKTLLEANQQLRCKEIELEEFRMEEFTRFENECATPKPNRRRSLSASNIQMPHLSATDAEGLAIETRRQLDAAFDRIKELEAELARSRGVLPSSATLPSPGWHSVSNNQWSCVSGPLPLTPPTPQADGSSAPDVHQEPRSAFKPPASPAQQSQK